MDLKTGLREHLASFLFQIGLTEPKWRGRECLSVATFHRVLSDSDRIAYPFPGLVVTPDELDILLGYFTENFDCGSLEIQHARYQRGHRGRPLLALTFDDAQWDNYEYGRAILAKHNVAATFFVPVAAVQKKELLWHDRLGYAVAALLNDRPGGFARLNKILAAAGLSCSGPRSLIENLIEESKILAQEARLSLVDALLDASDGAHAPRFARLMTFDELAELAHEGHEIGSHSMTHCLMPECDDNMLEFEISQSRLALQASLARPIESFCYPNGNYDSRSVAAVAKAGYRRAVTTKWGRNGRRTDPYRLRRFDMDVTHARDSHGDVSRAIVAFRMSGLYPGLG